MKIATYILSIFLAITIVFNSLNVSFTYAYYYLDKSGFIEKLCINKDKPEMKCNGKCHLKKVIESNKTDDNVPVKALNIREITLFVVKPNAYKLFKIQYKKAKFESYNNLYAYSVATVVDHPPQFYFS